MFRFFRRNRGPKTVFEYLDIAAAILRARGKSSGRMYDEHGRVDVLGALRLAILGEVEPDKVSRVIRRRNRWMFWQAYQMCKDAIVQDITLTDAYVIDMPDDWKDSSAHAQAYLLQKWSDNYSTLAVAETLERIARGRKRTLEPDELH